MFGQRGSKTGKNPGTKRLHGTAAFPGGIQTSVRPKNEGRQRFLEILEEPDIRASFQQINFPRIGREIELPFFLAGKNMTDSAIDDAFPGEAFGRSIGRQIAVLI